jgi:hypothetical protein
MDKLKIAHHLKTVLPAEDFILTGTFALSQLGFGVKVNDLDIILVNPTQSTLEVLDSLEKANPPKNLIDYPTPLEIKTIFRFIHDDVNVDVFIRRETVSTEVKTNCGLKVASLKHIVKAKRDMNRPKDIIQLLSLSREIITTEEFDKFVKSF